MKSTNISFESQYDRTFEKVSPTSREDMDRALEVLSSHKKEWASLSLQNRIDLIDQLIKGFFCQADNWVSADLKAKHAVGDKYTTGFEWMGGPVGVLRTLQGLRQTLADLNIHGHPTIPGPVRRRPDGQVVARVFPAKLADRILFSGYTCEVWMEPGVSLDELPGTLTVAYQGGKHPGKVALVLGAGNSSGIPTTDVLYKLLVEKQVVLLKVSPVNEYLGPFLAKSFRSLVEAGFLQIVYGGVSEGKYLCHHSAVDEILITGSRKTFETIVFGEGADGKRRKVEGRPLLTKPIAGELGNVGPVIVVPGPWKQKDFAYHAEHLASQLSDNAGHNCYRARVIIQHTDWKGRDELLTQVREILSRVPLRTAFYPGAIEQYEVFLSHHPNAEQFGTPRKGELPWTLVPGVNPDNKKEICFTTEAFCPLIAETAISASSVPEFIDRAVEFANDRLWGTLSASLIVHPTSMKDPEVSRAIDRAVANLRYGTVAFNCPASISWVTARPPWGAYPGSSLTDIQSGVGFVHNTFMLSRPQKVVVRVPFHLTPHPVWFVTRGRALEAVGKKLAAYEATLSWRRLPGIIWSGVFG